MPPAVIAAKIAALASISAAIISALVAWFSARRSAGEQRKLELLRGSAQHDLEELKAQLALGAAEKSARRAYEFDALKRLYEEVEPLLFQLYEAASFGSNRIRNMARASRDRELEGWMSDEGYYFRSTIHSLLVPMGMVHILRQRLTFLDLSLEAGISRQYELGKALNRSFSRDHEFAAREPAIDYHPNDNANPDFRQGVFAGNLMRAVARVVTGDKGQERVKTFAELNSEWDKSDSGAREDLEPVMQVFRGFTPEKRPILWRILIAQLLVYRAIRLRKADLDTDALMDQVALNSQDLEEFTPAGGTEQMKAAVAGAEAFLREALAGQT